MSSPVYFEDYVVDSEHTLGSYTVTEEEIVAFARQYDPQPFHVDRRPPPGASMAG